MPSISLSIPDKIYQKLLDLALEEKKTVQEKIREILEEYLKESEEK
ncbi:MAG: hypothetical protein QXM27_02875 [Candidatus Pacearchaeota archaeon]